jgi:hypothetical protein
MARFEEVQMKIAEAAKKHIEIYNMQVLIEQFTMDRECRFFMTLTDLEKPFPLSAIVSFTYDAFQTGYTMYEEDEEEEEEDKSEQEIDTSVELEVTINLPIMQGNPDIEALFETIEDEYPDTEPILITKEVIPSDEPTKEYEISYTYNIDSEDAIDEDLYNEIFEELKEILELIYGKTKNYIDMSWYGGEEDDSL